MIILASRSPRRAKLLRDAGINFKIVTSDVEEAYDENLEPAEIAMFLARQKAKDIATANPEDVVIGADTIVVFDSKILGKPKDEQEAYEMLSMLSNKHHKVYTGVSIIKGEVEDTFYSETKVYMKPLSDIVIKGYISTLEPMDKAGAYGIQGQGGALVKSYEGDFFTVMGLPLSEVLLRLKKHI